MITYLNKIISTKKLFVLVIGLLFFLSTYGQTSKKTVLYAKPYKDSIALRWQVYDVNLWQANIKKGYDIYRKSKSEPVQKINDSTIKALNPKEFVYRYLKYPKPLDTSGINEQNIERFKTPPFDFNYNPDSVAMNATILQFPEEVGLDFQLPSGEEGFDFGNDKDAIRWLFHSIICLSSKEASIISGIYFMDKKTSRKEIYTYYLTTSGEGIDKALAEVTISPLDSYPLKKPIGMKDVTNKNISKISWNKADTSNVYLPTYNIYRSENKNGSYVKMNNKALLAVYSKVLDSNVVYYDDTTLQKGKMYYYKVHGLDLFGEFTPYSDPYVIKQKTLMEYAPYIEEARKVDSNSPACSIKWVVEDREEENISSFIVYRSSKPDSLFKPISIGLKNDQRFYKDKNPSKNNYYKVVALGKGGDSLWSAPVYVLIADSIPPKPAIMLSAVCDSLGIVTVKWKHNNDIDLHSFNLYRSNYKNEEFSRVTTIEKVDTIYRDTVSLETLTESIYYKIIAYDDSYNPSVFSNVIKAKRYDIIPPVHPVFTELKSDSSGINLTWANSSSEDVIKTILYRRLQNETSWHEHKVFVQDTVKFISYADTNLYKGQWYEYALEAFDDDKLRSGYSTIVRLKAFDNGIRPEIKTIKSKSDVRKGIVKLSWDYKHQGVEFFQVYRAENDGKMSILQSLKPSEFECYDKYLTSGKKYRYRLKAVFKDGGESPFSREISVQF